MTPSCGKCTKDGRDCQYVPVVVSDSYVKGIPGPSSIAADDVETIARRKALQLKRPKPYDYHGSPSARSSKAASAAFPSNGDYTLPPLVGSSTMEYSYSDSSIHSDPRFRSPAGEAVQYFSPSTSMAPSGETSPERPTLASRSVLHFPGTPCTSFSSSGVGSPFVHQRPSFDLASPSAVAQDGFGRTELLPAGFAVLKPTYYHHDVPPSPFEVDHPVYRHSYYSGAHPASDINSAGYVSTTPPYPIAMTQSQKESANYYDMFVSPKGFGMLFPDFVPALDNSTSLSPDESSDASDSAKASSFAPAMSTTINPSVLSTHSSSSPLGPKENPISLSYNSSQAADLDILQDFSFYSSFDCAQGDDSAILSLPGSPESVTYSTGVFC